MNLATCKYGTGTFYPFAEMGLFGDNKVVNTPDDLTKEDCLVVWGGADISPSLYGKAVSKYTHADKEPSFRDSYEWACMQRAKELEIPIIGVCRGAQMLCALAGGHLIQHVENHGRSHAAVTIDGQEFQVSSLHHQMMYPWDVEHTLLAWSKEKRSDVYYDVNKPVEVHIEPEAVYFPKVHGLAVQYHPEFMDENCHATRWTAAAIKEYLL